MNVVRIHAVPTNVLISWEGLNAFVLAALQGVYAIYLQISVTLSPAWMELLV